MTAFRLAWPGLLIVLIVFASCSIEEGDDAPLTLEDRLAEGKALLAEGRSGEAAAVFRDVLELDPSLSQARYGLVLADLLDLVGLVDDFAAFLVDQLQQADPEAKAGDPGEGGIGGTLDKYVGDIFLPIAHEMLYQASILRADPAVVFDIQTLPVEFGGEVIVDLGGRWDATDADMLLGLTNLLAGAFDAIMALDLDFDLGHVFELPIDWQDLSSVDLLGMWRDLVHLVVVLLTDPAYPNFLGPDASAPERMPRAAIELGLACKYLAEIGPLMTAETGDQTRDVIAYVDANANGVYDDGEPWRIAGIGVLDPRTQGALAHADLLLWSLRDSLVDGSTVDPAPDVLTPFDLSMANPALIAYFGWEVGLLPPTAIDLGGLFLRPQEAHDRVNAALLAILRCIDENEDPVQMLRCLLGSLEPAN